MNYKIVFITLFVYIQAETGTLPEMIDLSHRDLAEELARVKTIAITEVPLGSMYLNEYRIPRADVLEIKPSYENFIVSIYDIKRSRSDFRNSIKTQKWKKYLEHSNRFYFACLKGICDKDEIPAGVGLLLRNDNGWYTRKVADNRELEIPIETMKSIMFQRIKHERMSDHRSEILRDVAVRGRSKHLGERVNKALHFYQTWSWQINELKKNGIL